MRISVYLSSLIFVLRRQSEVYNTRLCLWFSRLSRRERCWCENLGTNDPRSSLVLVYFLHTQIHTDMFCNTEQVFAKLQFPQETVDVRSNVFVLCCYCWNSQPASLSCLLSVLRLRLWRCLSKLWLGICVTRDGPKLDKNWEPRRVDLSFCFVEKCVCVCVYVWVCVYLWV